MVRMQIPFDSPFRHGFARVAVAVPQVSLADPKRNAEGIVALCQDAHASHATVVVFPELCLTGYSNDDLFHQETLLRSAVDALEVVRAASASLAPLILVGMPLRIGDGLYNVAVAVHGGRLLGLVPKSFLPSYREFYETRQFRPARDLAVGETVLLGQRIPVGTDLLFQSNSLPDCVVGVELCEDLWTPVPPSGFHALAGATIIANLSASNVTIGKDDYRRSLCLSQSARCLCAYAYSAAGAGESTTDMAWDGHAMVAENGVLLAESTRYCGEAQLILADIDTQRLAAERMRQTSWGDSRQDLRDRIAKYRKLPFDFDIPAEPVRTVRRIARDPFVPAEGPARDARCAETYAIQVHGLEQRLRASRFERIVIGVSGGLDSTHALIVAARTVDRLGISRRNILAATMPGFATSDRTLANARSLMESLGVDAREIDIRPSCLQMMRDIGHPFSDGQPVYDITFENVQAGERTSHLFRLANQHNALVLGTGDLSELALGWCTYGVGEHMSHYNVNASVPKTLIQFLIRWIASTGEFGETVSRTLVDVADTEISPELVPGDPSSAQPAQRTEEKIGPYVLQDFHLYYLTRFGFAPDKIVWMAENAFGNQFDRATLVRWLELFLRRFFTQQFKRSCVPNAPKVGSGGSLSPRGDWRMPSDARVDAWLEALRRDVPLD